MNFQSSCTIPVSRDALWDFLLDIPTVCRCVPGLHDVSAVEKDTYRGLLKVKVGPIALNLRCSVHIGSLDKASWSATASGQADDIKIRGGLRATTSMFLYSVSAQETELKVETDVTFLGKLGEFGQAIIRRKSDALMQEFAENIGRELAQACPKDEYPAAKFVRIKKLLQNWLLKG